MHQTLYGDNQYRKIDPSKSRLKKVSTTLTNNNDVIRSWEDLCNYCDKLHLSLQVSDDTIRRINLKEDPMIIDFTILIDNESEII